MIVKLYSEQSQYLSKRLISFDPLARAHSKSWNLRLYMQYGVVNKGRPQNFVDFLPPPLLSANGLPFLPLPPV